VYTVDFAAQSVAVSDSFEAPSGWTVGAPGDTAFTGVWNRGAPQATSSQPGADVTPGAGTDAWVTDFASGGSDGAADVDGGATSLISPVYDLSGVNEAVVGYWRWFSNDAGASPNEDVFRVFVSNDGGASWSVLEEVGPGGVEASGGWFEASIRIDQVLPLSDAVRFKFVAEDAGSGSLVEAAIDDLSITVLETCCPGDADGDGAVDLNDLLAVLGAFGTTSTDGDIDGDGVVDLDDLLSVLSAFGGVCE
jgi:hypothetical protein